MSTVMGYLMDKILPKGSLLKKFENHCSYDVEASGEHVASNTLATA